jgi:hypothetical protein
VSRYCAFGDEGTRQALIADIRAKGPVYSAWLTSASIDGDIAFITQDYGLHPALAHLLPALGAFGEAEDAIPFHEAVLRAIPVGAETGTLARQALLLAWTDPAYGRSKVVRPGAVRHACEEIVALVRKSLISPVDKMAWRAGRSKLVNAHAQEKEADMAVDLVLSLAWDLDQSPGAAHDVMSAWLRAVTLEADASDEDQFTDEENVAFNAAMNRINDEATAVIANLETDEASLEEFLEETSRRWAADPVAQSLKIRSIARRARSNTKVALWRAAIQRAVMELAQGLPFDSKQSGQTQPSDTVLDRPLL